MPVFSANLFGLFLYRKPTPNQLTPWQFDVIRTYYTFSSIGQLDISESQKYLMSRGIKGNRPEQISITYLFATSLLARSPGTIGANTGTHLIAAYITKVV